MTFEELKFTFKDAEYATAKPGSGHVDHMISVNEANRILKEKLASILSAAPEVRELRNPSGTWVMGEPENAIAKARLVCIEEIK